MRLLLVEDDKKLSDYLSETLRQAGFEITLLSQTKDLETTLRSAERFEMIVLDRLLHGRDTKSFVPQLKARWPQMGLLILSAICTPNEKTELLNLGADDYMGKPFSSQELVARIKALRRRAQPVTSSCIQLGNTWIDSVERMIKVRDQSESLPTKEFLLIKTLSQEPGRVWSRSDLLDDVWGMSPAADTNVVEATVANLRKRLSELGSDLKIKNMRNAGYWIEN